MPLIGPVTLNIQQRHIQDYGIYRLNKLPSIISHLLQLQLHRQSLNQLLLKWLMGTTDNNHGHMIPLLLKARFPCCSSHMINGGVRKGTHTHTHTHTHPPTHTHHPHTYFCKYPNTSYTKWAEEDKNGQIAFHPCITIFNRDILKQKWIKGCFSRVHKTYSGSPTLQIALQIHNACGNPLREKQRLHK